MRGLFHLYPNKIDRWAKWFLFCRYNGKLHDVTNEIESTVTQVFVVVVVVVARILICYRFHVRVSSLEIPTILWENSKVFSNSKSNRFVVFLRRMVYACECECIPLFLWNLLVCKNWRDFILRISSTQQHTIQLHLRMFGKIRRELPHWWNYV